MKRFVSAALICLLVAVALFLFFRPQHTVQTESKESVSGTSSNLTKASATNANPGTPAAAPTASATQSPASGAEPASPEDLSARAGESVAETNAAVANLPPDTVLQNVRRAIHQYGGTFGGNPVGTNPEITAALAGSNPKGINFLRGQPGLRVNDKGEMVDAWGTPYFFHQLSGTEMEIHSAGPDKVMWTTDDLVTK